MSSKSLEKKVSVSWFQTWWTLVRKIFWQLKAARVRCLMMVLLPAFGILLYLANYKLAEKYLYKGEPKSADGVYDGYQLNQVRESMSMDSSIPVMEKCRWYDVYGKQTYQFNHDCVTVMFAIDNGNSTTSASTKKEEVAFVNRLMQDFATTQKFSFAPMEPSTRQITSYKQAKDVQGLMDAKDIDKFLTGGNAGHLGSAVFFQSGRILKTKELAVSIYANNTRYSRRYYGGYGNVVENAVKQAVSLSFLKVSSGVKHLKIQTKVDAFSPVYSKEIDDLISNKVAYKPKSNDYYYEMEPSKIRAIKTSEAGTSLTFALIINALLYLSLISIEKEGKLIGSLRSFGVSDSAYWCSWMSVFFVLNTLSSLVAMAVAYIFSVPIFSDSSFWPPFFVLVIGGFSVFTFTTLIVALVRQQKAFIGLGLAFLISGVVVAYVGGDRLFHDPHHSAGIVFRVLFPVHHISKILFSMGTYYTVSHATTSGKKVTNLGDYSLGTMGKVIGNCNITNQFCHYTEYYSCDRQYQYQDCRVDPVLPTSQYRKVECAPDSCYFYPYSDATNLLFLLCQVFLYMFLSWYLLQVVNSDNGIAEKAWFLFDKRYWFSNNTVIGSNAQEQQQSKDDHSVRICNVSKVFGKKKKALNSISTVMEKGQIYVMLGHNGAGKTTLINILTGKISATSGDAFISGISVQHDVSSIQKTIGVVPQHDLLWNELSARQHIELFARLKGQFTKEGVNIVLEDVHLSESAENAAGGYSGGMKRRLSIALAQIGNPAVVFMDEPTTGIDPLNRRRIWKLIQKLKEDRIVVLTTHLMEEADLLGDKIAVLHNGDVQALGTPLHLKSKYGRGYSINLVTEPQNVLEVQYLVHSFLGQDMELIDASAGNMTIGVNKSSIEKIPELAREFETRLVQNSETNSKLVLEWSISQSPLEEVFLRLAGHDQIQPPVASLPGEQIQAENVGYSAMQSPIAEDKNLYDEIMCPTGNTEAPTKNVATRCQQLSALWKKFLRLQKREFVSTTIQILLSIVLVILSKVLIPVHNYEARLDRSPMSLDIKFPSSNSRSSNSDLMFSGLNAHLRFNPKDVEHSCQSCGKKTAWIAGVPSNIEESWNQNSLMNFVSKSKNGDFDLNEQVVRSQKFVKQNTKSIESLDSPYDFSDCAVTIQEGRDGYGETKKKRTRKDIYFHSTESFQTTNKIQKFCSADNQNQTSLFDKAYGELFPDLSLQFKKSKISKESIELDVEIRSFSLPTTQYKGAQVYPYYHTLVEEAFCSPDKLNSNQCSSTNKKLTCHAKTMDFGCPNYQSWRPNLIDFNLKIGFSTQDPRNARSVRFSYSNIKNTIRYHPALSKDWILIGSLLLVVPAFLAFPPLLCQIVMEKSERFVFTMLLHGLQIECYWIFMFLNHLLACFIPFCLVLLLSTAFSLPFMTNSPDIGYIFLGFFIYVYAQFGLAVLCSNIFKRWRLAAIMSSLFVLALIFGVLMIQIVENFITHLPVYFTIILPPIGFARLLYLSIWSYYHDQIWEILGLMFASGSLFGCVGIFLHASIGIGAFWNGFKLCNKKVLVDQMSSGLEEDESLHAEMGLNDVQTERKRAMQLQPSEAAIKIDHLHKIFNSGKKKNHAVNDLCMAMDYGEVFGLLGPNGAGKTTVISMLVGQFDATCGTAYVSGHDIKSDRKEIFKCLGIVPQFDILYPNLTVSDHLEFYGEIKGIPKAQLKERTIAIATKVSLQDPISFHTKSKALSGGMKRRLSIAIAMLNDPDVLFLDEPTTGIDVQMKRDIWNIIERMKSNKKCVILTTHAMDEAETLCNRIGIMAKGQLKCVGRQHELRSRYGETLQLTFSVAETSSLDSDQIVKFFAVKYPSVHLKSSYAQTRVYDIVKTEVDLMSNLFRDILNGQEIGLYSEWGICQTSLDEVFCSITAESEGFTNF